MIKPLDVTTTLQRPQRIEDILNDIMGTEMRLKNSTGHNIGREKDSGREGGVEGEREHVHFFEVLEIFCICMLSSKVKTSP
jgi:hypothetical protein